MDYLDQQAECQTPPTSHSRRLRASGKPSYRQVRSSNQTAHRSPVDTVAEQFRILRQKGTEHPFTSQYDKHHPKEGVYTCGGCDTPLYKANHKFDSGCGWPAFWDAVPGAVLQRADADSTGRTEIVCNNCGGHLGHIFKGERFGNPKNERHCVNGVSINFSPEDKK